MTGTPQGGIVSPLLANVALTALDRRYAVDWADMSRHAGRRQYLRKLGHPTYRLVRFADDLVFLIEGTPYRPRRCSTSWLSASRRSGSL